MENSSPQELTFSEPTSLGSSRNPTKPATFHHFSGLPHEIQNLVWGFVEAEPRIIVEKFEDGGLYFAAPYGTQPVLHVSSSARAEGLRRFRPVLASWSAGRPSTPRYYHVDFSRDIFYLQPSGEENLGTSKWGSGIHWMISGEERLQLIQTVAVRTEVSPGRVSPRYVNTPHNYSPHLWVDRMLKFLAPHLDVDGALREVLIVQWPLRRPERSGEMGLASVEGKSQWMSDFRSYGSQFPHQLLEFLLEETDSDFNGLRQGDALLREEWEKRLRSSGKTIDLRFVHRFFVTEHNNRNELLAGDVPLRSRYFLSR